MKSELHSAQAFRHPREVAEAAAVENLKGRFQGFVAQNTSGPKEVPKKVPVHGKVNYFPPGWRVQFRKQKATRFISASDVSGTFAAQLGVGKDVKPLETVVNGNIIDLRLSAPPKEVAAQQEADSEEDLDLRKSAPEELEADEQETDSEEDREIDLWILRTLEVKELRDLCQEAGLNDAGTRNQLIKRLMNPELEPSKKRRKTKKRRESKEDLEAPEALSEEDFKIDEELERRQELERLFFHSFLRLFFIRSFWMCFPSSRWPVFLRNLKKQMESSDLRKFEPGFA